MKPGTILYDNAFEYDDGTTGKKFLIVLNDGKLGFYIVVRTSSKQKNRNTHFRCQLEDRYPNFFLPENSCWFDKNITCLLLECAIESEDISIQNANILS